MTTTLNGGNTSKFLQGKNALVTGASRGLGRAVAQELAALGALVAVNYASNDRAARETLALIEGAGGQAFLVKRELGSLESAEKLAAALDEEFSRRTGNTGLDILVNNAGGGVLANIDATTAAILEKTVADNFTGPFYVTKVLKSRLRSGGHVINMSSEAARTALAQYVVYSMCKAAINTFTVIMAKELGPRGITVNAIMPGLISTDSNADIRADAATTKFIVDNTLLGRLGEPSDIAGVVRAFVSPQMGFVTGQIITVSGGLAL
jgi:3-oxoacyl-[acyl-carrier protein] reductase